MQLFDNKPVPSVALLPAAVEKEGVTLEGWFCRFDAIDSERDRFSILGMDDAMTRYMANNPVVLLNHKRSALPVGKCLSAEITPEGVRGKVLIPKAILGAAGEIYEAAKNGLLHTFSLSGLWDHVTGSDGIKQLLAKRIVEVSVCATPVGETATRIGGPSVVAVKAIGDAWVPAAEYEEAIALQALSRELALAELTFDVAALLQRSARR
jgi:hypothetical protein